MGSIGLREWIIIAFIILLIFGSKRLPELARSIGKALSEFRKGMRDVQDELQKGEESGEEKKEGNESS